MFEFFVQAVSSFAIVSLTGYFIYKIRTHASKARPVMQTEQEGVISPGKGTAWFCIIVGVIMILGGLLLVTFEGVPAIPLGLSVALFGAILSGFMAPSLSSIHDVNWNAKYVEGASRMFGPTLGKLRTQIEWPDITSTGTTVTQYWYIQSKDGRRIYWSYLYNGHGAFAQVLARKCPSLKLSF